MPSKLVFLTPSISRKTTLWSIFLILHLNTHQFAFSFGFQQPLSISKTVLHRKISVATKQPLPKKRPTSISPRLVSKDSSTTTISPSSIICLCLRGGANDESASISSSQSQSQSQLNKDYEDYEEELVYTHKVPPKPFIELPNLSSSTPKVGLIFMDNFSPYHGQYLAYMARKAYKAGVVNVLSGYMMHVLTNRTSTTSATESHDYTTMRIPSKGTELQWAKEIPFDIVGIYCESDSGLPSAERLGMALGLHPHRHDGLNRARRDKYLMNRALHRYGLSTVKQRLCSTLEEALDFAKHTCGLVSETSEETTTTNRVVVKPTRGVASDNVHLCSNLSQLKVAYSKIHQTPIFGSPNQNHTHVLLQQFAKGTEYAIDIVSKNGHHKVAALWRYDKRSVNGAPFVYHATILEDPNSYHYDDDDDDNNNGDSDGMKACRYAVQALDALNLKWGLSHVEVMVDSEQDTIYLIEVNCRQHNTDFAPMTSICIGYNALDLLLSAYLGDYYVGENNIDDDDDDSIRLDWDLIPDVPSTRVYGAVIHLVCHVEGRIRDIQGLDELENLESVRNYQIYESFSVGCDVSKTVDIRTDAGWVHILHDDYDQFWSDYNRIMDLMEDMFLIEDI